MSCGAGDKDLLTEMPITGGLQVSIKLKAIAHRKPEGVGKKGDKDGQG